MQQYRCFDNNMLVAKQSVQLYAKLFNRKHVYDTSTMLNYVALLSYAEKKAVNSPERTNYSISTI